MIVIIWQHLVINAPIRPNKLGQRVICICKLINIADLLKCFFSKQIFRNSKDSYLHIHSFLPIHNTAKDSKYCAKKCLSLMIVLEYLDTSYTFFFFLSGLWLSIKAAYCRLVLKKIIEKTASNPLIWRSKTLWNSNQLIKRHLWD